ncbi:penicillin-binding protein 2 [Candidatus Parcubacteria bacterium]|nr:penicillin-binding protein 2 [Candidatus Parcubacteria bacterium]
MITFAKRIRIVSLIFVSIALILIVKLYIVQVANHENYLNLGDRQYIKKNSNINDRGDIYFTKKDGTYIVAATMQEEYTLYINPKSFFTFIKSVKNIDKKSEDQILGDLKSKVIDILKLDAAGTEDLNLKILKVKDKKNDVYFELVKGLNEEEQTKIKALQLEFLGLGKEKKRFYPGNELASNVIGTLGFKGDVLAGRYGLEKQYENTLARNDKAYSNFFVDLFSGAKKVISNRDALEGNIYTTIEPIVQKELEKKLMEINNKQSSDLTGGIIMDPYTGEIVAMAKVPTFSHDDKKDYDISNYKNDIVESSYEMGSIIKPLTMSVGIDTDKVHKDSTYNDAGFIKVRDRTIYNFDKKSRGVIDLQTALSQSLNTGFVYVAKVVGNDALTKYFTSYGLREKTNIDLPNESSPLTNNLDKGDVEHATISFGQGIAMSPIGTIRALSVVINGGYVVNPHVVSKIKYEIGNTSETKIEPVAEKKSVLKQTTVDEIRSMLVYNVDNALLDGKRKNPRYSIGAKTGTAQIASQNGGYIEGKNIHTFIGFFPAYQPKFVVFMYTVDPKVSRYASESLANPFLDLSDFLIQYYEIQADR